MFNFNCKPTDKVYIFEQIRDQFIFNIENGTIRKNTPLPSINNFSKQHGLSAGTVGRAYQHLKYKGYISYVSGKGFFVVKSKSKFLKILFLINRFDNEVQMLSRGMLEGLGYEAKFDLQNYQTEAKDLYEVVAGNKSNYDHLVIMPTFRDDEPEWLSALFERLPQNRVEFNKKNEGFEEIVPGVIQITEADFYGALKQVQEQIYLYDGIIILADGKNIQSQAVINSVKLFCNNRTINYKVIHDVKEVSLSKWQLYIVCDDELLVELMRNIRHSEYEPGKDIGIISTHENLWKEFLGITVFSSDFTTIGRNLAFWLSGQKKSLECQPFNMIRRNSF